MDIIIKMIFQQSKIKDATYWAHVGNHKLTEILGTVTDTDDFKI